MVYFVRDPSKFVTRDNVGSVIFFGVLRGGDALHSLLQLMHGLYVPVVVTNTTWPETVKSDFTAQLHKFMANLTETVYEVKGKTILYIPQVGAGGRCRATRSPCSTAAWPSCPTRRMIMRTCPAFPACRRTCKTPKQRRSRRTWCSGWSPPSSTGRDRCAARAYMRWIHATMMEPGLSPLPQCSHTT